MKLKTFLFILLLASTTSLIGQDIQPAPSNKAVVYFVRTSSYGFAINFSYFDSTKLIGIFAGQGYIRYECEPGSHLFWARSENKDFIEANVEAGKIYFIEAIVKTGWVKAGVEIVPVDPNSKKMKAILKVLNKKSAKSLAEEEINAKNAEFSEVISRGLKKYKEEKESGGEIKQLESNMFYSK